MTSRRSMQTYSERLSRALQFQPGHVGGRVASAQPIRRRGGTLRSASVGAAGAAAPVLPELVDWYQNGSGALTRYDATTNDVFDSFATAPKAGDMAACVLITEAAATVPSGWTLAYSHTFDDFTYYVATIDTLPTSPTPTWALDWTGVSGLGEWAYTSFVLSRTVGAVSGLTWDTKAVNNDGVTTGTWATVTDAAWLYSIPLILQEDCEYDRWTYGDNSYGYDPFEAGVADTNAWVTFPAPSDDTLPATYAPGATQSALIWAPDQSYDSDTGGYTGTPSTATLLLGVKPA